MLLLCHLLSQQPPRESKYEPGAREPELLGFEGAGQEGHSCRA